MERKHEREIRNRDLRKNMAIANLHVESRTQRPWIFKTTKGRASCVAADIADRAIPGVTTANDIHT